MTAPHNQRQLPTSELEGDPALLQECLGAPDGLGTLGLALWSRELQPVTDGESLRRFIAEYRDRVLVPIELPAIRTAFLHACRYEVRELLAADRALSVQRALQPFAFASQAVGRGFLRRLRPLRDVRLLRRYEKAVQQGEAHGWHTLVYGVVLAIYSLPLRQGLLGYARQTLRGFLETGAARLRLREADLRHLEQLTDADLPDHIQGLCAATLRCLPDPSAHDAPQRR
jgi:urease accessory protein UreF